MKTILTILPTVLLSVGLLTAGCGEASIGCDPLACSDGNPCTEDSCNPTTLACEHLPASDGTSCAVDGTAGACAAGVCTEDACGNPRGCGFPGMGRVEISLTLGLISAEEVLLEAMCDGWVITARFFFQPNGTWRLVGPLPTGTCTGRVVANDEAGESLCTYNLTFDVEASAPTEIDKVIICAE